MCDILTNLATTITRKVRDIGHMKLCDGFEYGIVTYRKDDQLVRRVYPDGNWRFVTDLEATIKRDIEAEQGMQDFEEAMWEKWQRDSVDPRAREF